MIYRNTRAALACALLSCASDAPPAPSPKGPTPASVPGDTSTRAAQAGATATVGDRPVVAAASDAPATADEPSSAQPAPAAGIDPTGVWWTEVMTLGHEVLPILDRLDGTNIRFVMRVEVSGTAPNNSVKFDFCQLQTEWVDPADPNNITTIGFRPPTVAAFSESVTADLGGLSEGSDVPLPSLKFRGGIDEAGQEFDEDGDTYPAVTAWVRTLLGLEIEVYETITISATLNLAVADEDTLAGTVDFNADAQIVTSNNVIIGAGTVVTITPDSTAVPVTAKRLPSGTECTALPSTITFTTVPPAPEPLVPVPDPTPP